MTPPFVLLTDFGPGSAYVGQLHLAIRRVLPAADVVDYAHDCPPGDVAAAAYLLEGALGQAPREAVFVVVVDPGVGTRRRILAASARGRTLVGPDNGVLAAAVEGFDVRALENPALRPEDASATFHGRDLMAPLAARLAAGLPLDDVGPRVEPVPAPAGPRVEAGAVTGRVLFEDRFGNLITDIPRPFVEALGPGRDLRVRMDGGFIDGLSRTYGDVGPGKVLAYLGSGGRLEIAVNGGRAGRVLGLAVGAVVRLEQRSR